MVLIGLSIFIAWLSFLCYQYYPSSWPVLTWPSWGGFRPFNSENITIIRDAEKEPTIEHSKEVERKADLDRRAMPPPQIVERLPTSDARSTETKRDGFSTAMSLVPMLTLTSITPESPPPALFPAQNSIQRASGSSRATRISPGYHRQSPLRSTNFLNGSTSRSPIPNRSPKAFIPSTSLAIPSTHSVLPKPRKKVTLSPGHSPLDWAHISTLADANLRGLPLSTPYLRVSPSLLHQHTGRKGKNVWTCLGGKVYNITPYLPYHPGGEPELMKVAGRDGTKLFGEVHPWVNWEGMLEPCLVGIAVGNEESIVQGGLEDMD